MTSARPSTLAGARIALLLLMAATATVGCGQAPSGGGRRVIVLGIDGLDPRFLERFMDEGRLPHFARLRSQGGYSRLRTTMPPLSPVAWSSFMTGLDPNGHGVFDFVHRDPQTMLPHDSTYRVIAPRHALTVGSFVLPLSSGGVELLRKGRTLWQVLGDAGVPTTVFRMPVNFPPVQTTGRSLSGMGTPDIRGTHGTFSFYTDRAPVNAGALGGGSVRLVEVVDDHVQATLIGPRNTFRRTENADQNSSLEADFDVFRDATAAAAKFVVQDTEFVLNEGEWSDWIPVRFDTLGGMISIGAVARFYLQQARPDFKLYVTPLQIDPADPALPISTPPNWSRELQAALGYFYTQELPEDTKAFSQGVFSGAEFWEQSQSVYRETRRALDHVLETFDRGLLFFYFSTVDQTSHMLYRYNNPDHPNHVAGDQLADGMRTVYEEMDEALGRVLTAVDNRTTLIVMSDHGFSPFYRGVNLNSWLLERGYLSLKRRADRKGTMFTNVDWSATTAYAVGLNGLYVNLGGRERDGIVARGAEHESLLDRLERDLLAMRDSRNGQHPVSLVYRPRPEAGGPIDPRAPDLVVGYSWGYRVSWESPLGGVPEEVFVDNADAWSGDHAVDYRLVPGVLMTNRRIAVTDPALHDLTVSVLDEFGVKPLPEMTGRDALTPEE